MRTSYTVRKERSRGYPRYRVWMINPGKPAIKVSRLYKSPVAAEFKRRKLEAECEIA